MNSIFHCEEYQQQKTVANMYLCSVTLHTYQASFARNLSKISTGINNGMQHTHTQTDGKLYLLHEQKHSYLMLSARRALQ